MDQLLIVTNPPKVKDVNMLDDKIPSLPTPPVVGSAGLFVGLDFAFSYG